MNSVALNQGDKVTVNGIMYTVHSYSLASEPTKAVNPDVVGDLMVTRGKRAYWWLVMVDGTFRQAIAR